MTTTLRRSLYLPSVSTLQYYLAGEKEAGEQLGEAMEGGFIRLGNQHEEEEKWRCPLGWQAPLIDDLGTDQERSWAAGRSLSLSLMHTCTQATRNRDERGPALLCSRRGAAAFNAYQKLKVADAHT